jgi:uracil-DNA glycosylase
MPLLTSGAAFLYTTGMHKEGPKYEAMKAIRDEVVALKESPLYEYRTKNKYLPVIGEGSHDAAIIFIGEAPGKNEALHGRPFVGAAGKLLNQMLEHVGILREEVYITNIVKDRPPENRDPLPGEIEAYGPFLVRQVDVIQPKVIATLGRFSWAYVMKMFDLEFYIEPISVAHGKTFDATASYGPIKIVPLYHPAAAIYNQHLKETLLRDFEILKKFV